MIFKQLKVYQSKKSNTLNMKGNKVPLSLPPPPPNQIETLFYIVKMEKCIHKGKLTTSFMKIIECY